jgi:hypothetical protein
LLTNNLDSLVSSQVYEIIKTIYSTPDSSTSSETRISVLQNTLGQLRLANIATLDAITTHFTRLIELTSATEEYTSSLAQALAPCILRPRTDTSLTMHERHSYRLIRDLFAHKEAIFGELKRASTLTHTPSGTAASGTPRLRGISTDESNRRANMEARNRAIASKSRNSSPAPHANGRSHRRDRSSDPPQTRFPIQTSPTTIGDGARKVAARGSLEVPDGKEASPVVEKHSTPLNNVQNNPHMIPEDHPTSMTEDAHTSNGVSDPAAASEATNGTPASNEKRDSIGRRTVFPARKAAGSLSSGRLSGGPVAGMGKRGSLGEEGGERPVGVQLSDRPMDD